MWGNIQTYQSVVVQKEETFQISSECVAQDLFVFKFVPFFLTERRGVIIFMSPPSHSAGDSSQAQFVECYFFFSGMLSRMLLNGRKIYVTV